MKTFNIIISTKNKTAINNFILFFIKYLNFSSNNIQNYFQNKTKRKKVTILKSPHVNKKSQEQFETKLFKSRFTIQVQKKLKNGVFFKKLTHNTFPNVSIKLKQVLASKNMLKFNLNIFNTNNFKIGVKIQTKNKPENFKLNKRLNVLKKKTISKYIITKKTTKLFDVLDLYGEFLTLMFK